MRGLITPEERGVSCALTTTPLYIVATILDNDQEKLLPRSEALLRARVKIGAALPGTLLAENIGIERILFDIVADSSSRYLVLYSLKFAARSLIDFKS